MVDGFAYNPFLPPLTGELQRTECLRSLGEISVTLLERSARGDLTGEFDVLDEGKPTEEVEEIIELSKSPWCILGITETIHHTCYAWVLFRQFIVDHPLHHLATIIAGAAHPATVVAHRHHTTNYHQSSNSLSSRVNKDCCSMPLIS
ncbi:hypothetical protein P8452_42272 [Trifolium repens]|nr:protein unc-13 protein [Trifolium repens]WJX56629.1 hypothetical protein P8452_42272 [Trifolium repens]